MNKQEIWIYAEVHNNIVQPVTFQLITKAKSISEEKKVVVILFETESSSAIDNIKEYGPDEIVVIKNSHVKNAVDSEIAEMIAQLSKIRKPNSILFGATIVGRSIAPRLQAKLNTGLTSDCLNLSFEGDLLIQTKPSYGDNIMCEIICPNHRPQMASARPNIFQAVKSLNKDLIITEITDLEFKKAKHINIINETHLLSKGKSISNADRVIALGRGASDIKSIQLAQEFAAKLGAKIGVTRPLTDNPNFSGDDQIGQSGNTISPKLLINLGVHGAVQFTTGIGKAEFIISVDKNPEAPIFKFSDYGYVGEVIPFLEEFLKVIQ